MNIFGTLHATDYSFVCVHTVMLKRDQAIENPVNPALKFTVFLGDIIK